MIESHIAPAGPGMALTAFFAEAGPVNIIPAVARSAIATRAMSFGEHGIELPGGCRVTQGTLHMSVLPSQRETRLVMVEPGITPPATGMTFATIMPHCAPVHVLGSVAGIARHRG